MGWFKNKQSKIPVDLIAYLIALLYGCFLIGIERLNPTNTDWLFYGDYRSGYLASEFFKNSPFLQWPITSIPAYGDGWNSILINAGGNVFTDLPTKYLRVLLPKQFQLVGFWTVSCFALQGFYSAKLVQIFSKSRSFILSSSFLFIGAPILLTRIGIMGHDKLGAHWILLCAIYLYFRDKISTRSWVILFAVAASTEIYLTGMVVLVFIAFLSRVVVTKKVQIKCQKFSKLALVPCASLIVALWLNGILSLVGVSRGKGDYRLGGLAYLNPKLSTTASFSFIFDFFSRVTPDFTKQLDGEGFQFLGTGILLGVVISMFILKQQYHLIDLKRIIPITLVGILLFVFSLSNRVVFLNYQITYWWPRFALDAKESFRATSRFGWLLFYLIYLAVVVLIWLRKGSRRISTMLVFILVLVQFFDQNTVIKSFRSGEMVHGMQLKTDLESFNDLHKTYSMIKIYPVFDLQDDDASQVSKEWTASNRWFDATRIAALNNLPINFAYLARTSTKVINNENFKTQNDFKKDQIGSGTLYVFASQKDFQFFMNKSAPGAEVFFRNDLFFIGFPLR